MARYRTAIRACYYHKVSWACAQSSAVSRCVIRCVLRVLRSHEHTITTTALYVSDSAGNVSSTNPKEKLGLEQRSGATDFRSKSYRVSTCSFSRDIRFRSWPLPCTHHTPWDHKNIKHVLPANLSLFCEVLWPLRNILRLTVHFPSCLNLCRFGLPKVVTSLRVVPGCVSLRFLKTVESLLIFGFVLFPFPDTVGTILISVDSRDVVSCVLDVEDELLAEVVDRPRTTSSTKLSILQVSVFPSLVNRGFWPQAHSYKYPCSLQSSPSGATARRFLE